MSDLVPLKTLVAWQVATPTQTATHGDEADARRAVAGNLSSILQRVTTEQWASPGLAALIGESVPEPGEPGIPEEPVDEPVDEPVSEEVPA